jgi:two-component system, NtrC family, sensor histidine kinase HydH
MWLKSLFRPSALGVTAGILLISSLHLAIPPSELHWHNVFQHLYYLPIVAAGLTSGWFGGLAAAVLAGLSNIPHNIQSLKILPSYAIDQMLDIPIFCAAGVLTGVLAERGRKHRADLERTTKRLTEVYQELQSNFEQMKRSERLFALGQLSAGLAHEIRNPLASIAGAAGILQRNSNLETKSLECLEIIRKECQRLNRLVGNFLDFARPRTPHYQQIDVVPVLDSVLDLARHAPGNQQIELRKNVSPQLPALESDPELLKQVLLNLVMNAIQAMPYGGEVVLSASLHHERVLIQVQDQGTGIQPENLDRIFDPFFTTKDNGSGLGLSVAHQIVEQHGGMLTAETNRERGMTFSVSLPLRHARHHET